MSHTEEESDEEIFFGKLTSKEMKIHIRWNGHSAFGENKGVNEIKANPEESIKSIETHSEPNLRPIQEEKPKCLSTPVSPIVNVKSPSDDSFMLNVNSPSDDSFLQIESMVSALCDSPRTSDNVELDNTFEVIEYILKNGPKHDKLHETATKENLNDINNVIDDNLQLDESSESVEPPLEKSPKTENQKLHKTAPKKNLNDINNVIDDNLQLDESSESVEPPLEKSPKTDNQKLHETAPKENLNDINNVIDDNLQLDESSESVEPPLEKSPKTDNQKLHETAPKENLNDINNVIDDNLQLDESSESVEPPLEKSPKTENLQRKEPPMMLEKTPKKGKLEINEHNVKTDIRESIQYFTSLKLAKSPAIPYFIPLKLAKTPEIVLTPSSSSVNKTPVQKTPVFKTPVTLSNKKTVLSEKRSPNRSNAYKHIASPIASYIKNSPQVPLVKDIHPRKPLPGPSSIPKLMKNEPTKSHNKENMALPQVAYKSAKKTKVINIDNEKMPQSQWAKKITSSSPRPTVIKHENREMNLLKKSELHKHEDSFADLSCVQAEVSLGTQKSAFKSNSHF